MKRKFGIAGLIVTVALSSAIAVTPKNALASDTGDILGALVGGVVVGSLIHKLSDRNDYNRSTRHVRPHKHRFRHSNRHNRFGYSGHRLGNHNKHHRHHGHLRHRG